jgi:hypothetical protein
MGKKLIRFDWAMKTLLRDKANFDVLEGFLCALFEDNDIKILNILESESNQENENEKYNRVDLLVEDSNKRKIFIEIQNTRETDFLERLLFGASKIIVENQELGQDFSNLSKVISISILYFNFGRGDDYIYYGDLNLRGLNTGNPLIVKKRINISETFGAKYKFVKKDIFPEFYFITVDRYKNIVKKRIDEWIYMIKNSEIAEGSTSKNIDKAKQKLAEINMTDKERKRYEKYLINTVRERDAINTVKEEGMKEGIKKGKMEGKMETAKELKKIGINIEIISKSTGLTIEQIDKL